jgi:hypothetical protein
VGSAYLANWDESNRGAPAPGLGWVGLSAAQMYQNGWLPDEAVLKITRNGVYEVRNSQSFAFSQHVFSPARFPTLFRATAVFAALSSLPRPSSGWNGEKE